MTHRGRASTTTHTAAHHANHQPDAASLETTLDLRAWRVPCAQGLSPRRLKTYAKTERFRRRVPLRVKVLDALVELPHRDGIVLSASEGARINIDNFRSREWVRGAPGARSDAR